VATLLKEIHHEILGSLAKENASFAQPVSSQALGRILNVTPSYVRESAQLLISLNLVGVRHGRGGGYYLIPQRGSRALFRHAVKEAIEKAGLTWGKNS